MNQQKYGLIISILVTILCALIASWAFLFYEISTNKGLANDVLLEIEKQKIKDSSLSTVSSIVENAKVGIATLSDNFIDSGDIAGFVEALEKMASEADISLSISNITFDKNSTTLIKPLGMHLDIGGTWQSTINFVGLIERLPKAISIDRVSLAKLGDPQTKKTSWKASFDIQISTIKNI